MDRYQFEDLISAYIENELSLSKRKELESYLAENPYGDNLVKQIRKNIKTLKDLPKITAKENFNERLLERIKPEKSHLVLTSKSRTTLFGFSIFHASILVSLLTILFILSSELVDSIPSLQFTRGNEFVDNKNIMDEKNINSKLYEEDILHTDFIDLKNDTTKKEKKDFSRNIKYVND